MLARGPVLGFIYSDKAGMQLLSALIAVAVLVPVANLAIPESSPFHISTYMVTLLGKYLCFYKQCRNRQTKILHIFN